MLRFEETPHKYYWDDVEVPSVTGILAPLHDWGMVPVDVLERAREFGVNVHTAVDLYNKDELDEHSLDAALAPRLNAFKKFLSETGFIVRASETRVYHKLLGYAGTYDFRGDWPKREKLTSWLIDIKSGDFLPPTVGLQTAAYKEAAEEKPRRRGCLQLLDNKYKFTECSGSTDFNDFVSILNYRRLIEKHNPRSLQRQHDFYPN